MDSAQTDPLTATPAGDSGPASADAARPHLARPKSGRHLIAYRASSALFGRRFYISIFFGAEKRTDQRLTQEGRKKSFLGLLMMALTLVWVIFWATVVIIGFCVVALYLLKSAVGINLFEQDSFLHPYFFD